MIKQFLYYENSFIKTDFFFFLVKTVLYGKKQFYMEKNSSTFYK